MVTKVENDVVYFTDCNVGWNCEIRWDASFTRQQLKEKDITGVWKYPGDPD